jgi:phosphatidate cytidylyltransferase
VKRIVPGLLLAAGWLLLLMTGSFLIFWAAVLLIGVIGAREYCRMTMPTDLFESDRLLLIVLICMPILATAFVGHPVFEPAFGLFLGFCGLIAFIFYHFGRFDNPLLILYRCVLGVVFIGFLASHLVLLFALPDGAHWLAILTAITAGSDTAAYLVGSRWGKRKLCPQISPKKTVEGAIGGVGGAVVFALLLSVFFPVTWGWPIIVVLAVGLSMVGMAGDLLESAIKRGTGSKDSGRLLAGHGGVLDRIDSLFLSAPVLYYLLVFSGY